MKIKFFGFLFFLFASLVSNAQTFNEKKLDNYFEALEKNQKFMGSVVLSHQGEIIYSKAFGFDDIDTKEKSTTETKYRVGSISKMFTSTLVLMAVEEGKLDLENTIETYFPEISNAEKITLRYLLNHSSGIYNFTNRKDNRSWSNVPRTRKELIERIADSESVFEPGSKNEYSNSNFILLTFILEDIYEKPYNEILKEKITKPVGLPNTYLGSSTDFKNNECYSYRFLGVWKKEDETDMSIPLGAGAVVSNPEDLTKFIEHLFDGKIISKNSLDKMTNTHENYGLGIFSLNKAGKFGYGHNGGIDGFLSSLFYFPDEKLSIALTSNGINYNKTEIEETLVKSFFDIEFDIPTFNTNQLSATELEKYTGVYKSETVPFAVSIVNEGEILLMKAEGQNSFFLEPNGKNIFSIDLIQATIEFKLEENLMLFKRHEESHSFTRNKKDSF